jgi:hypothetical protein
MIITFGGDDLMWDGHTCCGVIIPRSIDYKFPRTLLFILFFHVLCLKKVTGDVVLSVSIINKLLVIE